MRSQELVPLDDLRRFANCARLSEGEPGYSRALLTVATACRLSARYTEGLEFLSLALEHAQARALISRIREIKFSTVTLHIAAAAFDRARDVWKEIEESPPATDNAKERNELRSDEARLALEEGDVSRAIRAFEAIEPPSPTYSVTRTGYYLALEIRIRLHQNADRSVIKAIVEKLERTHMQMRAIGAQDFESLSVYIGLSALGQEAHGRALLNDYLKIHRRAKWPLRDEFKRALRGDPICLSKRAASSKNGGAGSHLEVGQLG